MWIWNDVFKAPLDAASCPRSDLTSNQPLVVPFISNLTCLLFCLSFEVVSLSNTWKFGCFKTRNEQRLKSVSVLSLAQDGGAQFSHMLLP